MSNSINIVEIYKRVKHSKLNKNRYYARVLELCYNKVHAAYGTGYTCIMFEVPTFVFGLPKFDVNTCTAYIMNDLRNNGFVLFYFYPRNIYISWDPEDVKKYNTYKNIRTMHSQLAIENEVDNMNASSIKLDPADFNTLPPQTHTNMSTNNDMPQFAVTSSGQLPTNPLEKFASSVPAVPLSEPKLSPLRNPHHFNTPHGVYGDGNDDTASTYTNTIHNRSNYRNNSHRHREGATRTILSLNKPIQNPYAKHTDKGVDYHNSSSKKGTKEPNFPLFSSETKVKRNINDLLLNDSYIKKNKDINHRGETTLHLG